MNKLYVGNLSYDVTSSQLGDLFAQAGAVATATVITDKHSGRSKGFGFVEFDSAEAAQKAIEMFNGKEFQGRPLVVNEARPMKQM
jgi:cold-inducible RNA-binding protein